MKWQQQTFPKRETSKEFTNIQSPIQVNAINCEGNQRPASDPSAFQETLQVCSQRNMSHAPDQKIPSHELPFTRQQNLRKKMSCGRPTNNLLWNFSPSIVIISIVVLKGASFKEPGTELSCHVMCNKILKLGK